MRFPLARKRCGVKAIASRSMEPVDESLSGGVEGLKGSISSGSEDMRGKGREEDG